MQTDKLTNQEPQQPNIRSGEEIKSGASNEDQLDRFKESIPLDDKIEAKQQGTPPSTGDEHLDAAKRTDKEPAEKNNADAEQDTIADKSGDVKNLGGATNLSLDQLINEGDNNR